SSTWLQCTVTLSPGFQLRTADPTRSTTPDASEPITWYGSAWRAAHSDSRPRRSRNANVGSGSKIEVQTVLKLMLDAMTARYTSSGANAGVATSSTWRLLVGSLSADATPSNMPTSSRSTNAARYDSGIGRFASSSPDAPAKMASSTRCILASLLTVV